MENRNRTAQGFRPERSVDPELLKVLRPIGKEFTFEARRLLSLPVGSEECVWVFLSGWIFGLRGDADGHLKMTELLGPGDVMGISGFVPGYQVEVQCCPLTEVVCLRIPTQEFLRVGCSNPQVALRLLEHMADRFQTLMSQLQDSVLLSLEERLEKFRKMVQARTGLQMSQIPQELIGWAVGAHPVSVSRVLSHREETASGSDRRESRHR